MDINSIPKIDYLKDAKPFEPRLDLTSYIEDLQAQTAQISESFEETARAREAYQKAHLEAVQATAAETKVIREKQDKIIDNQQALIEYQKIQIRELSEQIELLKDLFSSGEDGVAVQKQIMQQLIDQENDKHPIRDYLADKGGDIGVAAVTAVGTAFWPAIKAWLISKGINIP